MEFLSEMPVDALSPIELVKHAESAFPLLALQPQIHRDRFAQSVLNACQNNALRAFCDGDDKRAVGYNRAKSLLENIIGDYLYGVVLPELEPDE